MLLTRSPSSSKIYLLFNRYSFITVAAALFIFELFAVVQESWLGDFWEHAAVIKALSENLLHPQHPLFGGTTPHAFFSPYALVVAAFAKVAHLNSIQALEYAAVFNLLFFLFSFHRFCTALFGEKANLVATVSLLLILFFWGTSPFGWSGFFHFMALHWVLPYPSTFAMALTFLTLSFVAKEQPTRYYSNKIIWIILFSAIVILSHPTTALLLFTGIAALNFCFGKYDSKYALIKSALLLLPALLLSIAWPYFSVVGLLFGNNSDFQLASKRLYSGGLTMYWPFLLLLPGVFIVKRDRVIYFFLLSLALMCGTFVLGYIVHAYGVGRLISGIMMFAHFLIAYIAVICLYEKSTKSSVAWLCILVVAVMTSLYINRRLIGDNFIVKPGHPYVHYDFLRELVKPNDIILSDRGSNSGIPTYNGKVIASDKPVYWVNDLTERRNAVDSFFMKESSDSSRAATIHKYRPDYILLDYARADLQPSTIEWIRSLGIIVYRKNEQELIRVKKK